MLDDTFKVVYLAGLVVGSVFRFAARRRAGRASAGGRLRPAGGRWSLVVEGLLLGAASVGMLVVPLVYLFTDRLDFADCRPPGRLEVPAGWLGAGMLAAAVWLLWRSHADLGRHWSPRLEIREGHSLVTEGVYRRIRHPMYAAHWLWGIAQALLLQNWVAGPAFLVPFVPLYFLRVAREERMLLEHFGEEYRRYMERTGRIIPRLRPARS